MARQRNPKSKSISRRRSRTVSSASDRSMRASELSAGDVSGGDGSGEDSWTPTPAPVTVRLTASVIDADSTAETEILSVQPVVRDSSLPEPPPSSRLPRLRIRRDVPRRVIAAGLMFLMLLGIAIFERKLVVRIVQAALVKAGVQDAPPEKQVELPKMIVAGIRAVTEPRPGPCPPEMALVTGTSNAGDDVRVCVDKWEGSIVEMLPNGEYPFSPYLSVEGHHVKAVSLPSVVPQAYISRDEAEVACNNAGKRLCAADEWQTACSGIDKTVYPYGENVDESACNTKGKAPLGELFPNYGEALWDYRIMNDPSLNALNGTVAKTGEFESCTNAFGVYDMVGNVHEWTSEGRGVFRGGYYLDTTLNGEGCKYKTSAHYAGYHDYSTGFRCCKNAD